MLSQDDANRQAYLEEARELLNDLEASLLELEKTPADTDLLHKIFRALHTIKGSGAMAWPKSGRRRRRHNYGGGGRGPGADFGSVLDER